MELQLIGTLRDDDNVFIPHLWASHKVRAAVAKFKAGLSEGTVLEATIRPIDKTRSGQQNRWLWGPCYGTIRAFLKETQGTNHSPAWIHSFMLQEVAGKAFRQIEVLGKTYTVQEAVSSSTMTTNQFTAYMDGIISFWADRGLVIPIPDPTEQTYLNS